LHSPLVAAVAKDRVRLIDSQPTVFAHFGAYQAQAEGYCEAENLDVSIITGRGGSDALQAVVTGSADLILAPGVLSVVAAYAKGAPVTIVANGVYGAGDVFWYVKQDSPIKSFKELDGKDLTYSSPGSLTDLTARSIVRDLAIRPNFVSVGTFAASRTQMMSGQTATAFSSMPANYNLIRTGEARIIGTGKASPGLSNMTTRVVAANTDWLAKHRDIAVRFMRALWKGHQFNFSGDRAIARYAAHWTIDPKDVDKIYDFYTLDDVRFAPVKNVDGILGDAQKYGFINQPLTDDQKKSLVTLLYNPGG
jgi:NitT/TauT family transport system substrate-binding protein